MLKSLLIISYIFLNFLNVFPQYNPGAKQIGLANSDVGLANDVFALFNNPAGLSQLQWREIGLFYSPAPFGFTEMANGYIAYNEPLSFGSIGIGGMTYGFELYRENRFTAAFSYNYENKFLTGVSLNYHSVSIKKYGSTGALYADIGGLVFLTEFSRLGFFIHNINHATFGRYKDQIPVILDTGLSIDLLENLSLNVAVEKDIRYNASISAGFDYCIIKYFTLRSGFSNEPSRYTAGVGIICSFIEIDYAVFTHPDLGLTHQAGLIIKFSSTETAQNKF
jgi:hypothetical protein